MAKENLVQKHVLVAKHTKLGEKPSKDLLTSLDITKEQLPKILIKDPAIKDLEINAGDIIKIERTSPTSGKSLYYRVVVG
jgi:DNA-directed RNA polymerase subunit H